MDDGGFSPEDSRAMGRKNDRAREKNLQARITELKAELKGQTTMREIAECGMDAANGAQEKAEAHRDKLQNMHTIVFGERNEARAELSAERRKREEQREEYDREITGYIKEYDRMSARAERAEAERDAAFADANDSRSRLVEDTQPLVVVCEELGVAYAHDAKLTPLAAVKQLKAERDAAFDVCRAYGRHKNDCPVPRQWPGDTVYCSCGWEQAKAVLPDGD